MPQETIIDFVDCDGSELWLPSGSRLPIPAKSKIHFPQGGMIANISDKPSDMTLRGSTIKHVSEGSRVVLLCTAVMNTPIGEEIKQQNVPAGGTIVFGRFSGQSDPQQSVFRRLSRDVTLQSHVKLPQKSGAMLTGPMTVGTKGLTLKGSTRLPGPVMLTGPMRLPQKIELPSELILAGGSHVQVPGDNGDELFVGVPGLVLRAGTIIPWGTRLPEGTTLDTSTVIPGGTTLPPGTMVLPGTKLPRGSVVPAGLVIPPHTVMPYHFVRALEELGEDVAMPEGLDVAKNAMTAKL
ncbi:hypothetical protein Micbo1qcDRAFT_209130 [Microdochium bolleyi]|uniref:Uncharacterized protein n=1 Tax=Microdochium bolleyi TaxID=196109 RepID=A0A136INA6_9PEZI|nr:hypothetical protein Micbo1qcDRAFT_209130 [Microdochium bolleyi]